MNSVKYYVRNKLGERVGRAYVNLDTAVKNARKLGLLAEVHKMGTCTSPVFINHPAWEQLHG